MVSGNNIMEWTDVTTALTRVGELVTQSMGIITANPLLLVVFCGGLLGIGFRVLHQAKNF